jgi:hypothetical protein
MLRRFITTFSAIVAVLTTAIAKPANAQQEAQEENVQDNATDTASEIEEQVSDVSGDINDEIDSTTEELGNAIDDVTGSDGSSDGSSGLFEDGSVLGNIPDSGNISEGIDETVSDIGESVGNVQESVGSVVENAESSVEDLIGSISGLNILEQFGLADLGEILSSTDEMISIGGSSGNSGSGSGEGDDGDGSSGSETVIGSLGLPDPGKIEQKIDNASTNPASEILATKQGGEGSPTIKEDAADEFKSNLTSEVARASALSEQGQEKLAKNAKAAQKATQKSKKLAEKSANTDVSQNIMRNLSAQQALQGKMTALEVVDAQLRQRDDALRNLTLSSALDELQRDRAAERRKGASAYSGALNSGAQVVIPGVTVEDNGG